MYRRVIIGSGFGLSPTRRYTITGFYIEPLGQSSLKFDRNVIIKENAFANVIWKMVVIVSKPWCFKQSVWCYTFPNCHLTVYITTIDFILKSYFSWLSMVIQTHARAREMLFYAHISRLKPFIPYSVYEISRRKGPTYAIFLIASKFL